MKVVYGLGRDFIFKDAIRFLKSKKPLAAEEYKALSEECRAKAFTVSGYTSVEVLQGFLDCLEKAVEEGRTKEQFRKDMDSFLEENGYKGLNPWRSDTIFRTNIQTAFQAGHYKSMADPQTQKMRPYWQYRTAGDGEVRESHAAMEGRVFLADDPVWDIWYPPNGFKCRCTVVSLSKRQVEQRGLKVEDHVPYKTDYETGEILPVFPDKGFSNNPAKHVFRPDMAGVSPLLKQAFQEWESENK